MFGNTLIIVLNQITPFQIVFANNAKIKKHNGIFNLGRIHLQNLLTNPLKRTTTDSSK